MKMEYKRMYGTQQARRWQLFFTVIFAAAIFSSTPSMAADSFDINKATAAQLEANLDGIGPKKAKSIIDYRKKNGSFKTTDDLLKVAGIGPGTVKKNLKVLNLKPGTMPLTSSSKEKTKPSGSKKTTSTTKPNTKSTAKSKTQKADTKSSTKK